VARIARVGGRPITDHQLDGRLARMRHEPRGRHLRPDGDGEATEVRRWLARELVTEAILAHEIRAAGLADLGDRAAAALFERVTAHVAVPDVDAHAFYRRNVDLYRRPEARRVRHVLLSTRTMAERVVERIRAGEEMAAVAWEASRDRGSRALGGDLGEVRRGEFAGPLEEAIFSADLGQIIGPIRSEHGWHVARVEETIPERTLSYAEVRPEIEAELLEDTRAKAFDAWLEERRRALAEIEPAYEHPGHPVHGTSRHRH
jgi:hypothetical protein